MKTDTNHESIPEPLPEPLPESLPHHVHGAACRELLAELGAYLDGDAALDACAAIDQHLEGCPDCRALVDTMRKSVQLARDLPQPSLTSAAKERLLAALKLK
jgi:predicted anti-sigma-YlaC factor YlaD